MVSRSTSIRSRIENRFLKSMYCYEILIYSNPTFLQPLCVSCDHLLSYIFSLLAVSLALFILSERWRVQLVPLTCLLKRGRAVSLINGSVVLVIQSASSCRPEWPKVHQELALISSPSLIDKTLQARAIKCFWSVKDHGRFFSPQSTRDHT